MRRSSIEIHGRRLGLGEPVYVIAEAGSNHNGDRDTALALIDVAADMGADAVKFQTFSARRLYPQSAGSSDYLGDARSIYDIIEAMEMPLEWLPALRERAHGRGLGFISSPFHEEAVDVLEPFVDAFKVASYELTHTPLLERIAQAGKPVLLSTGASTLEEANAAVGALRAAGAEMLVVLQCTARYPAPLDSANVRVVATLRETLGVLSGLSDHTRDPTAAPMAATALGAAVIEKHFTLSNRLPGPDHAFAIEPHELGRLVEGVRRVEQALGTAEKTVLPIEEELRHFARRSLFTTRTVTKGEVFSRENVDVLRHGKLAAGLPPSALGRVLGRAAARDLAAETPLQESDLAARE